MPILLAAFGFSRGRRSASVFSVVLFLSIAGRSNEVCAVPGLVGLEFCALPILFAAFGFLLVSFVIVSFQHFVKASVVAWSLDFIC